MGFDFRRALRNFESVLASEGFVEIAKELQLFCDCAWVCRFGRHSVLSIDLLDRRR